MNTLLEMFSCKKCSQRFRTKNQLTYHVRKSHQMAVKLTNEDGAAINVYRIESETDASEGFFICPSEGCEQRFTLGNNLQRHYKLHHISVDSDESNNEEDQECLLTNLGLLTLPNPGETPSCMLQWNLLALNICPETYLILCTTCHHCLPLPEASRVLTHVKSHLNSVHHARRHRHATELPIIDQIQSFIDQFNFVSANHDSINQYWNPTKDFLPAVDGIVIQNGFFCVACPYFSARRKTMVNHRLSVQALMKL